jgi:hypothetical protein
MQIYLLHTNINHSFFSARATVKHGTADEEALSELVVSLIRLSAQVRVARSPKKSICLICRFNLKINYLSTICPVIGGSSTEKVVQISFKTGIIYIWQPCSE